METFICMQFQNENQSLEATASKGIDFADLLLQFCSKENKAMVRRTTRAGR